MTKTILSSSFILAVLEDNEGRVEGNYCSIPRNQGDRETLMGPLLPYTE